MKKTSFPPPLLGAFSHCCLILFLFLSPSISIIWKARNQESLSFNPSLFSHLSLLLTYSSPFSSTPSDALFIIYASSTTSPCSPWCRILYFSFKLLQKRLLLPLLLLLLLPLPSPPGGAAELPLSWWLIPVSYHLLILWAELILTSIVTIGELAPVCRERRSWFMKWLCRLFKGPGANTGGGRATVLTDNNDNGNKVMWFFLSILIIIN